MRLAEVTSAEAGWFQEALVPHGDAPRFFEVGDDNKHRSDRTPPNAHGGPRGNLFFEKPGDYGALRLETIIHQAAAWRLHDEFGWPPAHLVIESPDIVGDCKQRLRREALDILLLEEPCNPRQGISLVFADSPPGHLPALVTGCAHWAP